MRSIVVEGTGTTFFDDQAQHGIETTQHLASLNTQRPNPRRREPGVAARIELLSVGDVMCGAIDLDAQADCVAVEVENVRTGGILSPEL